MSARISQRDRYEQAAEWLLKVQAEGAPPETFAEMLAWCDADPGNKLAMEKIEEAWALAGEVTDVPLSEPPTDRVPVGRLHAFLRDRFGRYGGWVMGAAAACVALAIGIVAVRMPFDGGAAAAGERIATKRGAHDQAKLADGSLVELGGKSSVSILYSPQGRVVVADDGEAYYKVSKDANRPFIVRAGPVTVTAIGTAFSVRRTGESVSVVVTEGAVDVRIDRDAPLASQAAAPGRVAVRAEAGQRVRYDRGELSRSTETVPIEVATAWREGRLQFVDEPLRLVVASVNRYYDRELLIADPATEELRFTGTVFEKGIDNWLQGVAAVFPVRLMELDKRRIMIAPAQSPNG